MQHVSHERAFCCLAQRCDALLHCNTGYINFYSVYIAWLCSAVFLHLPSVGKLGLDIKADISILLTTFLVGGCPCLHQWEAGRPWSPWNLAGTVRRTRHG